MNAWEEARLLADAEAVFQKGYNYDIPNTQCFGSNWNYEGD